MALYKTRKYASLIVNLLRMLPLTIGSLLVFAKKQYAGHYNKTAKKALLYTVLALLIILWEAGVLSLSSIYVLNEKLIDELWPFNMGVSIFLVPCAIPFVWLIDFIIHKETLYKVIQTGQSALIKKAFFAAVTSIYLSLWYAVWFGLFVDIDGPSVHAIIHEFSYRMLPAYFCLCTFPAVYVVVLMLFGLVNKMDMGRPDLYNKGAQAETMGAEHQKESESSPVGGIAPQAGAAEEKKGEDKK